MNRRRLRAAAKYLRNLKLPPNATFDMTAWGVHNDDHRPGLNDCGTAACGWGWIAMSPTAQKAGVRVVWGREIPWRPYTIRRIRFAGKSDPLEAAEKYFGISPDDAAHLFMPWCYPRSSNIRPSHVARRLEALADRRGK